MVKQTQIKVDLTGLNDLIQKLGKDHYTKVGILGGNAAEKHKNSETVTLKSGKRVRMSSGVESPFTNAEIAVIHEFGSVSRNIPPRSFLRMPIEEKKNELIRFLGSTRVKTLFDSGDIKKIFKILGIEAERIVQRAFESRGFGRWDPNAPSTIAAKGSSAPLIDTSQLRRSITSKVVSK